jgi:hypothetical protein
MIVYCSHYDGSSLSLEDDEDEDVDMDEEEILLEEELLIELLLDELELELNCISYHKSAI